MASHLTIKYTSRELRSLSIPTDAMGNRRGIAYAPLALILIASIQGSEFSRDESQEDQRTEFNLASTLTGGISSSRHRQRANLNSPLYPGLTQLGGDYGAGAGATGSIDDAHGHEQGGSGVRVASTNSIVFPGKQSPNPALTITGGHQFPAYPPPGFPAQQAPVPYPSAGGSSSGGFQSTGKIFNIKSIKIFNFTDLR